MTTMGILTVVGACTAEYGLTPESADPVAGLERSWTIEGKKGPQSEFGQSVSSAGDVNGDGFDDILVGSNGTVVAFHGSATGVSKVNPWVVTSTVPNDAFGFSVASAGDVDGDGFDDVIIGAPMVGGFSGPGTAYVYPGSATGLSPVPVWTATSNDPDGALGFSVASAGDVNGDGFDDVVVGAPDEDFGDTAAGGAYVYFGSPSGPSLVPDWSVIGFDLALNLGHSVSSAGDVNDDGFDDVLIGEPNFDGAAPQSGLVALFLGSSAGLSVTEAWSAEGKDAGARLGLAVAAAGDVDGDGFDDVVYGTWTVSNPETAEGIALAYHGEAGGLSASPKWSVDSDQGGAWFGWSVASAGDYNGDGFDDVVVGSPHRGHGEANEGAVYVHEGSATGLAPIASFRAESNIASADLGWSVASAGDVDGDGYDDVIAGAPGASRVWVYFGK